MLVMASMPNSEPLVCPTWRKAGLREVFSVFVLCLRIQKFGYSWLNILNTSHLSIFETVH